MTVRSALWRSVLPFEVAASLQFTDVPPSPDAAAEVLDALVCLARGHPELVEINYPHAA